MHGFRERKVYSTTEQEGMGDSWGALAVPYLLAKYVFPMLQLAGWVGLREAELLEKARSYSVELRANWGRLKVAHVRAGTANGRSLKKDRWCDGLLYRAQVSAVACATERAGVTRVGGAGGEGWAVAVWGWAAWAARCAVGRAPWCRSLASARGRAHGKGRVVDAWVWRDRICAWPRSCASTVRSHASASWAS